MVVELTRMSPNGQVVIPSGIRKSANIMPHTQFLVLNEKGDILLKKIEKEKMLEDLELIKDIEESEEAIKKGNVVELDSKMDFSEMDKILMEA